MRKLLGIFVIAVNFFVLLFLQLNFFNWFNIANVKPNLFLIIIVILAMHLNKYYGFAIGVIWGLFLDSVFGSTIGAHAIILGICGLLAGQYIEINNKVNRISIISVTFAITVIYNLIMYIFNKLIFTYNAPFINILKIISIEGITNIMLVLIVYPYLMWLSKILLKLFKEKRVVSKLYS